MVMNFYSTSDLRQTIEGAIKEIMRDEIRKLQKQIDELKEKVRELEKK